jgi:hypothetical protein
VRLIGVKQRLPRVAVEAMGLRIAKVLVEQLGEAAVEILLRYALRQAEAHHDSVGKLLVALYRPKLPLTCHLLLQQLLSLSKHNQAKHDRP